MLRNTNRGKPMKSTTHTHIHTHTQETNEHRFNIYSSHLQVSVYCNAFNHILPNARFTDSVTQYLCPDNECPSYWRNICMLMLLHALLTTSLIYSAPSYFNTLFISSVCATVLLRVTKLTRTSHHTSPAIVVRAPLHVIWDLFCPWSPCYSICICR